MGDGPTIRHSDTRLRSPGFPATAAPRIAKTRCMVNSGPHYIADE